MGKIRVKTFDESSSEDEAKIKAKKEAKKAQKEAEKARVSGMGGGQRVKTVGPTEEELASTEAPVEEVVVEAADKKEKKEQERKICNRQVRFKKAQRKSNGSFENSNLQPLTSSRSTEKISSIKI